MAPQSSNGGPCHQQDLRRRHVSSKTHRDCRCKQRDYGCTDTFFNPGDQLVIYGDVAVNPVTNKIYVTSFRPSSLGDSASMTVINEATNIATSITDPAAVKSNCGGRKPRHEQNLCGKRWEGRGERGQQYRSNRRDKLNDEHC